MQENYLTKFNINLKCNGNPKRAPTKKVQKMLS